MDLPSSRMVVAQVITVIPMVKRMGMEILVGAVWSLRLVTGLAREAPAAGRRMGLRILLPIRLVSVRIYER